MLSQSRASNTGCNGLRKDCGTRSVVYSRKTRRVLLAVTVLGAVATLWVLIGLTLGHANVVRGKVLTCENNLRLLYLAQWHLPPGTQGLPQDKRTVYALANDMGWTATVEEVEYLGWKGGGHPDMSGQSDAIYCFDDPDVETKMEQVPVITSFTAASDIPPSSYVWYPESNPQLLAACPYHRLAVRVDTGELVSWITDSH